MDCTNNFVDVVYAESRSEGVNGMKALVHVIMNRSKEQGKPPCIIIRQPKQFAKGIANRADPVWQVAKKLVLAPGPDITKGATYFHNLRVRPTWAYRFKVTYKFGNHIFYKV